MSVAVRRSVAPRLGARRSVAVVGLLLGLAVALVLVVARGGESARQAPAGPAPGKTAPAFSLPDLHPGRPEVALVVPPGRPTVVNFFAAWCEPCKRELPALRQAAERHAGQVAFLGVDHQDSREDAIERLEQAGITYPAGYDPKGEVAPRYGLRGLPGTVFIAPDGRIVETHQGELSPAELEKRLAELTLQSRSE